MWRGHVMNRTAIETAQKARSDSPFPGSDLALILLMISLILTGSCALADQSSVIREVAKGSGSEKAMLFVLEMAYHISSSNMVSASSSACSCRSMQ